MLISYGYRYNSANQRDRVSLADNSYWDYGYDNLGQVTSGKRKWQDGSFVAGQQHEYTFDDIGNRVQTKVGGDANGANLRPAGYTPNLLNQYADRAVPGTVDVLGLGVPATAVSVNGNTASRKGEYFHYALPTPNSGSAQYTTVSVVSGAESSSGKVFVPQNPEVFAYDLDGNLTSDGRWNYTWDAENRLIKMESFANAPAGSKRRLEFAYDFIGRRIWKRLTNLDTSAVTEERFLYDGWNLVAVLSPSSATILKSFVWGTDLSGLFQGAGGVGGLLKVNDTTLGSHFCAYDGNGNIVGLAPASGGDWSARYEFNPFGEVIRSTGPMAKANPFRFSTKYQDDETDLLYYGERYYSASTGRWNSKEPLNALTGTEARYELLRSCGQKDAAARSMAEDAGEAPEYTFVRNSPVALYDLLGLCIPLPDSGPGTYHGNVIKHRFGAPTSSLTFRACCPRPTEFLAWYGITSPLPPPPPSLHGDTFPGSFTEVSLSGGDAGNQRCYTIVLNVPSTYSWFEQTFIKSIRVVGGCCCDRTFPIPRSDPPPLPVRPPPSQGAPVWEPL